MDERKKDLLFGAVIFLLIVAGVTVVVLIPLIGI